MMFVLALSVLLSACGEGSRSVVSIAPHPKKTMIMYVATNDFVYKTRDGGKTWAKLPVFSARRVVTVAIDPKYPATIYAGTMGDAVYKSPDGGQRWLPHNVGLKEHISYVNQFVFDPLDSHTIYAATTVGAYRTRDGGRTWEEHMNGMKEVHIVVSMALNPKNPNVLYAGTTGGVYRSTDAALTWEKINTGLIPEKVLEGALSLGVNALVVNPVTPATVYAGTTKGLFKTTNAGDLWARIGESLPDQFISSIVIDPASHQTVYIGGRAGIHKSDDGGTTWNEMNEGLETTNIRTIVVSPRDSNTLFAGTNGSGLYVTTNGGQIWEPVPLNSPTPTPAPRA